MVMASIKERFKDLGLTDILALDASIKTDIRYATVNNFTGKVLYNEDLGVFCVPDTTSLLFEEKCNPFIFTSFLCEQSFFAENKF